jgi:NAD(P)-dependent dehydrogenase (short-subunit alcohol dehydrogenase family)
VARFGRLDIAATNAGIARWGAVAEIAEADFDAVFELNAKGTFFALAVAFLASDETRWITGQNIQAGGGVVTAQRRKPSPRGHQESASGRRGNSRGTR